MPEVTNPHLCANCGGSRAESLLAIQEASLASPNQVIDYISRDGTQLHYKIHYFCSEECAIKKCPGVKAFPV